MTKEVSLQNLRQDIDGIPITVIKELERDIKSWLDQCGLFYKIFFRIKKSDSIWDKWQRKVEEKGTDYRMQDLIGARIVVYFKEDILLCEKIIRSNLKVLEEVKDQVDAEHFSPQRINYVCVLPEVVAIGFDDDVWDYPFDKTFEIQIRTVFSEGWHEVEHDFRYKCKEEWSDSEDLNRAMNGVFATLENCDWTMARILQQKAYHQYKEKQWISMLKNVLLIRISDCNDMENIIECINETPELAKALFRMNRTEFLLKLSNLSRGIPLRLVNIVYLINAWEIHNEKITQLTPEHIKELTK